MRALFRARSAAGFARVELRDGDFLFAAVRRFVETDFEIVAQIRAAQRTAGIAARAAAKQIIEDTAARAAGLVIEHFAENLERIVEVAEAAAAARGAPPRVKGRVPILVIGRAFLRLIQDLVSLAEFLEFLLGGFVARIFVGMMFDREFAIGLFDLLIARAARHAKDFVIVSFRHRRLTAVGQIDF